MEPTKICYQNRNTELVFEDMREMLLSSGANPVEYPDSTLPCIAPTLLLYHLCEPAHL
jgi:hypothetical protein